MSENHILSAKIQIYNFTIYRTKIIFFRTVKIMEILDFEKLFHILDFDLKNLQFFRKQSGGSCA